MSVIKVGSVVRLKSGGPNMTVSSIDAGQDEYPSVAYCDWFVEEKNGGHRRENATFPLTSLDLWE